MKIPTSANATVLLPLPPDWLDSQQKQPIAATITASWKHKIVGSKEKGTVRHEAEEAPGQGQRIFKKAQLNP